MFNDPHFSIIITGSVLAGIFILFIVTMLISIRNRLNRKNEEYFNSLLEERENTMYFLAMELHDDINQRLQMLSVDLHLLEDHVQPDGKLMSEQMRLSLQKLMYNTQNISYSLNPKHVSDIGLIAALQDKVAWINATQSLTCTIEIEGERKILPDQTGLMVLRIAQEAIQNVLKYAQASTLVFQLRFGNREFEMRIIDNGKGMDTSTARSTKGTGIKNMQQRATIVKGEVRIHSFAGQGTSIVLKIPDAKYIRQPADELRVK